MRHIHIQRLPRFDYSSDGYYFITIVSRLRLPIFVGFEETIRSIFQSIADDNHIVLDTIVVMPNHVHCILQLSHSELVLGEVVRRMKAKVSYVLQQSCWQSNYYERVIRSDDALNIIREYIMNNPVIERLKMEDAHKWARHEK